MGLIATKKWTIVLTDNRSILSFIGYFYKIISDLSKEKKCYQLTGSNQGFYIHGYWL